MIFYQYFLIFSSFALYSLFSFIYYFEYNLQNQNLIYSFEGEVYKKILKIGS